MIVIINSAKVSQQFSLTWEVEETIINKLNIFSVVNIRFIVHYLYTFAKIWKLKWN